MDVTPIMPAWLEQAWLQRYLDRDLTTAESEWFEGYALGNPDLVAAIEADSDLRDGLSNAAPKASAVAAMQRRPMFVRTAWLPMALAATLVVGTGIGWVLRTSAPHAAILSGPTRIVFDAWRGELADPIVHPGSSDTPFLLIEVGLPADASDVVLHANGQRIPLQVSPDGFASFLLAREGAGQTRAAHIEFHSGTRALRIELPIHQVTEEK